MWIYLMHGSVSEEKLKSVSFSLQSSLSLGHLPRLFSTSVSCLLSPHTQIISAATQTLKVGYKWFVIFLILFS